jgi:hypothetical protein
MSIMKGSISVTVTFSSVVLKYSSSWPLSLIR